MTDTPKSPIPGIALYIAVAGPLALLVLLLFSNFFWGGSGWIAAHRPFTDDSVRTAVLVKGDDGSVATVTLPTAVVRRLDLPAMAEGTRVGPRPDVAPTLHKAAFSLGLTITHEDGQTESVPTTSPYGLGAAALFFAVGFFVRNIAVSGSPLHLTRRPPTLDLRQAPQGQPATPRRTRGKQGPPPPRRRKGRPRR